MSLYFSFHSAFIIYNYMMESNVDLIFLMKLILNFPFLNLKEEFEVFVAF